jgi:hypothetical protein
MELKNCTIRCHQDLHLKAGKERHSGQCLPAASRSERARAAWPDRSRCVRLVSWGFDLKMESGGIKKKS